MPSVALSTRTRSRRSCTWPRSRFRSAAPTRCSERASMSSARSTCSRRSSSVSTGSAEGVRELGRRLRAGGSVARTGEWRRRPGDALRRLQARQRGDGAALLGRELRAVGRDQAVRRLRGGPRPGHDVRPDRGDAGGRTRRELRDPLRRGRPVRLRAGRRPGLRACGCDAAGSRGWELPRRSGLDGRRGRRHRSGGARRRARHLAGRAVAVPRRARGERTRARRSDRSRDRRSRKASGRR